MSFRPLNPNAWKPGASASAPSRCASLLPNLITLLALCAGLTAIRLAFEGKLEWALGAIVFAAVLDGIDGRVARLIKGQSQVRRRTRQPRRLRQFRLHAGPDPLFLGPERARAMSAGSPRMVFAICGALRLARFNVMIDDPNRPLWAGNFFTGVPAPAGALVVMLPIYVDLLGGPKAGSTLTLLLHARDRVS